MVTDGKFLIKPLQNFTQAIQQELRLNNEECSKLEQNSIWTQILNEIEDSSNLTVYNNNTRPNKDNNYFVNTGSIIEFSQESWNRIINWVKSIFPEKYTNTNTDEFLKQVPNVPDLSPENIEELVKYNDIKYANQKGVKIGKE